MLGLIRRRPLFAAAVALALYFPAAYIATVTYVPDPNSPPPSAGMRARIDLSSAVPMPQSAFAATARDVRSIFEAHGDANDSDTSSPIELWEDSKKLGPAHSSISEIVSLGLGRFRLETGRGHGGWLTWSSSDNTNPMTNGRTYWVVKPKS
jgi:hypothetical protein